MPTLTAWSHSRRRVAVRLLVAALVLVVGLGVVSPRADDLSPLAGRWTAEGAGPDGIAYAGTALLTVRGDSLLYEGDMDGQAYRGVGIWHPATATLALDFVEEATGRHGVAHFVLDHERLDGRWVFSDEPGDHGIEVWTRVDE